LLRERDYRTLLASQFMGQGADGVAQAVFATVLVLDPLAEGSPGRILQIFALTLLPYSFISPFLGVFVDRWDRRRLLIGTNLARCGLLVAVPLWTGVLRGETPLLFGALVLLGLGRLFHTTKGAVIPVVLHEHHLLAGNTVSSVGGTLSLLAGGGIGLWLAEVLTLNAALVGVGIVYGASAVAARGIRADLSHRQKDVHSIADAIVHTARELIEGLQAILVRPRASIALFSIFALRTFIMIVIIAVILLIKSSFGSQAGAGALALGAAGAGAFFAALSTPHLGRWLSRAQLILLGFMISGAGIAALGGIATLPAIMTLMAIGGLGSFMTKVSVDSEVQEALPDAYRGRAFALYDILYNVASVTAGSVVVLWQHASLRMLLVGAGVANLAVGGAIALAMRGAGVLPSVLTPTGDDPVP
jgi:hypothetical protein